MLSKIFSFLRFIFFGALAVGLIVGALTFAAAPVFFGLVIITGTAVATVVIWTVIGAILGGLTRFVLGKFSLWGRNDDDNGKEPSTPIAPDDEIVDLSTEANVKAFVDELFKEPTAVSAKKLSGKFRLKPEQKPRAQRVAGVGAA